MDINATLAADAVNQYFIGLHNIIPVAQVQASQAATDVLYQSLAAQLTIDQALPLVVVGKRLKKQSSIQMGGVWLGLSPVSSEHLNPREVGTGAMLGNQFIDGAFVVEKHGKAKLFKRQTPRRYPIEPVNAYIARVDTNANAAAETYIDTFMTGIEKNA